jgi:hypothetical protein
MKPLQAIQMPFAKAVRASAATKCGNRDDIRAGKPANRPWVRARMRNLANPIKKLTKQAARYSSCGSSNCSLEQRPATA